MKLHTDIYYYDVLSTETIIEISSRAPVRSQAGQCGICGRQSGTDTGFSLVLRSPTNAPYSLIHLPSTLHSICN
jgi:hypothetical protein